MRVPLLKGIRSLLHPYLSFTWQTNTCTLARGYHTFNGCLFREVLPLINFTSMISLVQVCMGSFVGVKLGSIERFWRQVAILLMDNLRHLARPPALHNLTFKCLSHMKIDLYRNSLQQLYRPSFWTCQSSLEKEYCVVFSLQKLEPYSQIRYKPS